jgi:hypothetical protein
VFNLAAGDIAVMVVLAVLFLRSSAKIGWLGPARGFALAVARLRCSGAHERTEFS